MNQWNEGFVSPQFYHSYQTRTETTVVEEEHYDADGKLTGKSKTTTTKTWQEPVNNWHVSY